MAVCKITIERVNEVNPHPNTDRLDIVQVLGFKVVCGRGQFKIGDAAIYFPANILIPTNVSEELGVTKYLKHAIYPGDIDKTQCRVSACRLRDVPSHGFVIGPVEHNDIFGWDLTEQYKGHKYEPPKRQGEGDTAAENHFFHQYTSIENIQRHPNAIPKGTEVRITEKLHGTNCRIGKIDGEYMAGSHKARRKFEQGLYWEFFKLVKPLLDVLPDPAIVFGEIFGQGVQDMDYGQAEKAFRVFDISIDGRYINWHTLLLLCNHHKIPVVPLLYVGPFSKEIAEDFTYGATTFKGVQCKFKDREGCVITPTVETFSEELQGRLILKSVSADYQNRKGAKDIE